MLMLRPRRTRWRKKWAQSRVRYTVLHFVGSKRDLFAIVLGILLAGALFLGAYWGNQRWHVPPQLGFGPEWNCADVPFADACVKRVQKPPE